MTINKSEIKNKITSLIKGETTSISSDEIGKPAGFGIIIQRNKYQNQYPTFTVSQCGDMIGQNMSTNEVVDFVARESGI